MRTFVIGDIHGNDILFRKALKAVSLKKTDNLILLGDLIDRGPNTKGVLDTILLLQEHRFENITCLRGNHEQMLLDAYQDENKEYIWIKNGGDYTLNSFRVSFANQIPIKYINLLTTFPYFFIKNKIIFVHAGLNLNIEDPFQDISSMLWLREMDEQKLVDSSLKEFKVIHGHTPKSESNIIQNFNNNNERIKCLDNGIYFKANEFGSLVIAELETCNVQFIK